MWITLWGDICSLKVLKAPGAVLTTFPIILILNSVSGPTQLTVAWEWGLGCKICSTQIIKLIMTGVRGGMWENGWGVCLCVCTCWVRELPRRTPNTETHTGQWALLPQYLWASFQFYCQQLAPICPALWAPNNGHLCSHRESKRDAARDLLSTYTQQPG